MSEKGNGTPLTDQDRAGMELLATEVAISRDEVGLARTALARVAGVTVLRIKDLEGARVRPRLHVLERVAWALSCAGMHQDPESYKPNLILSVFADLAGPSLIIDERISQAEAGAIEERWAAYCLSQVKVPTKRVPHYSEFG